MSSFRKRRIIEYVIIFCVGSLMYSLLEVLVQNRGLALSRDQLLDRVWGCDFAGGTRTVDVHISRLRAKLGLQTELETVFKYGYRLTGQCVQLQSTAAGEM